MTQRFEIFTGAISQIYRCIQKLKAAEMTELGLRGTHVMCLFYLNGHQEGLTAAELSRLCAEDKAAVSRTVAELQSRGYVTSERRRYRALLRLTEKGREAALHMDGLIRQWVGFGGGGISDEDREVFYRVLSQIAANLRGNLK